MVMNFCPDCGDLLPDTSAPAVGCECCGKECEIKPSESGTISTFQTDSKLRKSHVRELTEAEKNDAGKEIDHDCPKCGNPKMNYYEVQLRSADEGSTIFYHCPKCGHRHNDDN